jgi:hypothetical protein
VPIEAIREALRALLAALPADPPDITGLSSSRLAKLRQEIATAIERLTVLSSKLDPITQPDFIFDPSNPKTIGTLIAKTLLEQSRSPLGSVKRFYGSGVYAIYYRGSFPAYAPIKGTDTPIYVGKADPATHDAITAEQQGERLWRRLADHMKSVGAAKNLKLEDFDARYLVVRSAWQNTAETYLISRFRPIWNNEVGVCYGFGKHGDSSDTRKNERSPWDTLHPGRPWATKEGNVPNAKTVDHITRAIAEHFKKKPPES